MTSPVGWISGSASTMLSAKKVDALPLIHPTIQAESIQ
jgi:hypothetical protein